MIEIKNLSKTYESSGTRSLDGITMNVKDGSVLGLIGTNGAGKSTLLRILAGIYRQDEGEVLIDGQEVFDNNSVKSTIAYISDDQLFLPSSTLGDMSRFYANLYRNYSAESFDRLVKEFGLDPNRKVNTFSKGMRRQGEVILALSICPKYLLCDETFDGLDPIMREFAAGKIMSEVARRGMTVILSSHNLREMEQFCDGMALIHGGKLLINKSIDEMRDNIYRCQAVFTGEAALDGVIDAHSVKRTGKLVSFIATGTAEELEAKVKTAAERSLCSVTYFEALPLTLEEMFSYELNSRGLNKLIYKELTEDVG